MSRRTRPRVAAALGSLAALIPALLPLVAGGVVIAACAPLLGPVFFRAGDNAQHLLAEYAVAEAMRSGGNPFGPLGLEFGLPLLRFYQPLLHLWTASWHVAAGLDLRALHLFTMVGCFALSPLSNYYFYGKIGLDRWAAGAASLISVISVAGLGNSFEAYLSTGIATHSVAALLFPLFAGAFAGLLRGGNGPLSVALLLSLAVIAHATMAIYAMLYMVLHVGAVLCLDGRALARLGLCLAVFLGLTAFWLFPFVEHTGRSRPVPDSVALGEGVSWWHEGATGSEVLDLLASGRLLDDARVAGRDGGELDRRIDQLNLTPTRRPRFPVVTALAALGALVALLGLRRRSSRLLLAGFALALVLYAGTDDFPFLGLLPFMERMQVFRSSYFLELFAFGLAGLGLIVPLRALAALGTAAGSAPARLVAQGAAAAAMILAVAGIAREAWDLGGLNLDRGAIVDADDTAPSCPALPRPGYPFRTTTRYDSFVQTDRGCPRAFGFDDHCSQWAGVGPTAGQRLCGSLRRPDAGEDLFALAGVRWLAGRGLGARPGARRSASPEKPFFAPVEPGSLPGLAGLGAGDDLRATPQTAFAALLGGRLVAVVADDAEWLALASTWTAAYADRVASSDIPVPLRLAEARSGDGGLPAGAAGLVVTPGGREDASMAEECCGARKIPVVRLSEPLSDRPVPVPAARELWARIESAIADGSADGRAAAGRAGVVSRRTGVDGTHPAYQSFAFETRSAAPLLFVLPMAAHPGWRATVDGRPEPVFPAGPDLVGLPLPDGTHVVVLEWEMPLGHRLWAGLSLVSWLLVVFALLRREKRFGCGR